MGLSTRIAKHVRSNVVGYVAVFLALTGTAAALPGTNSVDSGDIINGQVKTGDLGVEAVTRGRLAGDSVVSPKIMDGAVKSTDLSANSVSGEKVADNSLTGVDVASGTLTTGDIAASTITEENMAAESLTGREVLDGSLTGADVGDNSLTGADVQESTLGTVPSASLAGVGRSASNGESSQNNCDPESGDFVTCVSVGLDLPDRARVLLIGSTLGAVEGGAERALGICRLGTSSTGGLPGTTVLVNASNEDVPSLGGEVALTAVTPPLGPGPVSFGIDCNQNPSVGAIDYDYNRISAVAIAPG